MYQHLSAIDRFSGKNGQLGLVKVTGQQQIVIPPDRDAVITGITKSPPPRGDTYCCVAEQAEDGNLPRSLRVTPTLFSIKADGTTCKLQVEVRNLSRKPVTVSPSVTLCQLCEVVDTRPHPRAAAASSYLAIIFRRIASGLPWFLRSTAEPMQHPHQCWR